MNTGLAQDVMHSNANYLKKLLADTYTLYIKTQNFHWNVTGIHFHTLHGMFETQYTALANAVDEIAERIRALGDKAPGSFAEFSKLTTVKEATGKETADEMLHDLADSNEILVRELRELFSIVDAANDDATMDLLSTRISEHEKTAWMLRATIG